MKAAAAILILAAGFAGPACADEWRFVVTPYVWAASLDGAGTLAGLSTGVNVPFGDVFDHLDLALLGEAEVSRGRWGVYLDGQYVKTSQDEHVLSQTIGVGITKANAMAGLFYRIYDSPQGGDTVTGEPRRFTVSPMAGVRWSRLEADVDALGQNRSKSTDWIEPFVGFRTSWDFSRRWNLSTAADAGGFSVNDRKSARIEATFGYRTRLLGASGMIKAGYRYFYQDFETDDFTGQRFHWDVTQQGPIGGLSFAF